VRRELPWIGESPEIICGTHHRAIGKARLLLDFYTHHQRTPDGRVYYGKTYTYREIARAICKCPRGRKCECPSIPTLKRYNARLREGKYVATETVIERGEAVGFTVKLLQSKKFPPQRMAALQPRPAPHQGHLFAEPIAMPAPGTVEKPVQIAGGVGSLLIPGRIKSDPVKDLRLKRTPKEKSNTRAQTPRATPKTAEAGRRQGMAARRILGEIDRICEIYAGSFDPADLARRDRKLELLYEQLRMTGWQEERAG
jgi:hypothetical protein